MKEKGEKVLKTRKPVAGNADLHRERQPAIKVHGFHGESYSYHLFFYYYRMLYITETEYFISPLASRLCCTTT